MNRTAATTSAPGTSLLPDGIGMLTTANFILIALFAALVLAGLIWGARQKRRRKQAEREVKTHNRAIEATPPPPPLPPTPPSPTEQPRVAPAPSLAPMPRADFASAPTDAANGPLTQLKGLGPKVATRLAELGITTVGQLAALRDDQAADLDAQLGAFAGRLSRDRWIEQARFLAAGDRAGFESVFGRL